MVFTCFPTPTRIFSAKSRSMFIPCDSPRASSGEIRLPPAIRYTSIYGTTILSQPESSQLESSGERLDALPRLPRDTGGPVFTEPWEAQAFALAVKLSEEGYFTWKE